MALRSLAYSAVRTARRYPLARSVLEPLVRFYRGKKVFGAPSSGDNQRYFNVDSPAARKLTVVKRRVLAVSGWAIDVGVGAAIKVRIRIDEKIYHPFTKGRLDVQQLFGGGPAECGFLQLVEISVGIHRVIIEIEGANGGWATIYNAVLLRIPSTFFHANDPLTYEQWLEIERSFGAQEKPELAEHIDVMLIRPVFSIVIDARTGGDITRNRSFHSAAGLPRLESSGVASAERY